METIDKLIILCDIYISYGKNIETLTSLTTNIKCVKYLTFINLIPNSPKPYSIVHTTISKYKYNHQNLT